MASRDRKRGKKPAANKVAVVSYSPLGLLACYDKLYSFALDRAAEMKTVKLGGEAPSDADKRALRFATQHLREGVVVADAGFEDEIPRLQAVLDKLNLGIKIRPRLSPNGAMIGVSSVAYRFEWDQDMKVGGERVDGSFLLKKGYDGTCFLTRVFAKSGFDTLVAYVDREASCDVTVTMIGIPDKLPDSLQKLASADQIRIALDGLYHGHIRKVRAVKDPPPLGRATLFDVDGVTEYELPDYVGKELPGGARVDEAKQVCRLFMNKDGGGVVAGTVMMFKCGMAPPRKDPVNIDFREFRNGYLVLVELSRKGKNEDHVALVVGWVNPPKEILAVL
jgi:hypothetical protein